MIKRHIPEAFFNGQSWPSFSSMSNVTNMTSLDLSIIKIFLTLFFKFSFKVSKSKNKIIIRGSFNASECFLRVYPSLEIAIASCRVLFEKQA